MEEVAPVARAGAVASCLIFICGIPSAKHEHRARANDGERTWSHNGRAVRGRIDASLSAHGTEFQRPATRLPHTVYTKFAISAAMLSKFHQNTREAKLRTCPQSTRLMACGPILQCQEMSPKNGSGLWTRSGRRPRPGLRRPLRGNRHRERENRRCERKSLHVQSPQFLYFTWILPRCC